MAKIVMYLVTLCLLIPVGNTRFPSVLISHTNGRLMTLNDAVLVFKLNRLIVIGKQIGRSH